MANERRDSDDGGGFPGVGGETAPGRGCLRAVAALSVALLVLGMVAVAGTAAAGAASTGHGGEGNTTIAFGGPADHAPGTDNASAAILSVNTVNISYLEAAAIRYPEGVPSKCFQSDLTALGIDRGSDDPGSATDDSLLPFAAGTNRSTHELVIEFNERDDPSGTSTNLAASDQFVLGVADCIQHPDEPGWYRMETEFTGADVESPTYRSHYFYVCDCANESEARETLGPPPSEETTPTPTATPTATTTPEPTATATTTPEPTDGEPEGTDTAATTATTGDGPGFGAVGALAGAALALVAGLLRRQRR